MKTTDDIIFELASLDQTDCAALQDEFIAYFDTCQNLHENGQSYEKAVKELQNAVGTRNKVEIENAVRTIRFAARDHGLVMSKASKQLAQLSSKCLSLSERFAAIISTEDDNAP